MDVALASGGFVGVVPFMKSFTLVSLRILSTSEATLCSVKGVDVAALPLVTGTAEAIFVRWVCVVLFKLRV